MRAIVVASLLGLLALGAALPRSVAQSSGYVVIVRRDNPVTHVSRTFVADALLKRVTRWPNGESIRPVDLDLDSPTRRRVTEDILHRTVHAVRSYWQQQIFSGRGVPPVQLGTDHEVLRYVEAHRGAIGYVSDAADTSTVKVVALR